jgi:hypothetical protein
MSWEVLEELLVQSQVGWLVETHTLNGSMNNPILNVLNYPLCGKRKRERKREREREREREAAREKINEKGGGKKGELQKVTNSNKAMPVITCHNTPELSLFLFFVYNICL